MTQLDEKALEDARISVMGRAMFDPKADLLTLAYVAIHAYLTSWQSSALAGQRCDDALVSAIGLLRGLGRNDQTVHVAIDELEFIRSHFAATSPSTEGGDDE